MAEAASMDSMDERWGFLRAWLAPLRSVLTVERKPLRHLLTGEFFVLAVETPAWIETDQRRHEYFCGLRHAFALLAMTARADLDAYKYALAKFCGLNAETEADVLNSATSCPRFVLWAEGNRFAATRQPWWSTALQSLLCEPEERNGSALVAAAMRIAALGGVDSCQRVDIPLTLRMNMEHISAAYRSDTLWQRISAGIRNHEGYRVPLTPRRRPEMAELPFDCGFQLGVIEMSDSPHVQSIDVSRAVDSLLTTGGSGLVFSRLELNIHSLSGRHCEPILKRVLCTPPSTLRPRLDEIEVNLANLNTHELAQVFSAIAVTRSTTRLQLRADWVEMLPEERMTFWEMLAFAVFSAHSPSTITSVKIHVDSISVEETKRFAEVFESNDPVELVFGSYFHCEHRKHGTNGASPIGRRRSTLATLMHGARIRNKVTDKEVSANTQVFILCDKCESSEVVALVPGYALGSIRREYILPSTEPFVPARKQVTEFTVVLEEISAASYPGLLSLLDIIGAALKHLTIRTGRGFGSNILAFDIVERCPNLETLDVRPFVTSSLCVSTMARYDQLEQSNALNDVENLMRKLRDPTTPTAQHLRHLTFGYWFQDSMAWDEDTVAIIGMLRQNRTLEYLSLTLPFDASHTIISVLKQFRLKPLPVAREPFRLACRLAFISVFATPHIHTGRASRDSKQVKTAELSSRRCLPKLDRNVLSIVFAFAAPCVQHRVYIRHCDEFEAPPNPWRQFRLFVQELE